MVYSHDALAGPMRKLTKLFEASPSAAEAPGGRDWAAKGTVLLGVKAVIAGSFERIHRSNLIGMGVLPLELGKGVSWQSLGLTGDEQVSIAGIDAIVPRQNVEVYITRADGSTLNTTTTVRIDTDNELAYYRNGGILHYVLRNLANAAA